MNKPTMKHLIKMVQDLHKSYSEHNAWLREQLAEKHRRIDELQAAINNAKLSTGETAEEE